MQSHKVRPRLTAVAALLLVSATAIACSSSGGSGDTSSSAAGGGSSSAATGGSSAPVATTSAGGASASTGAATGSPIKVGGIGLLSTPSGEQPFAGLQDGAKAAIANINASGGILGHPLQLTEIIDDHGDPQQDLTAQHKLVEQDHVTAILPIVSPGFTTGAYLQQHKILYLGNGFATGFCGATTASYGFSFSGCGTSTTYTSTHISGLMDTVIPAANRTVSILADDSESAANGMNNQIVAPLKKDGWNVCSAKATLPTQISDYSPFAQQAATACGGKAPSVFICSSGLHCVGLSGAVSAVGFKGVILNFTTHNPDILKSADAAKSLNGSYAMDFAVGAIEASPTEFAPMLAGLKAMGKDYPGEGAIYGWASVMMLKQLMVQANSTDPTAVADFANKGTKLPGEPGVFPPTSWPMDHEAPTPCGSLVKIEGTKFVGVTPLTCFTVYKSS